MMPPTTAALEAANRRSQLAFHDMLVAGVFPDTDHPLTKAYVASERVVDELMAEAQGRAAQDGLDAVIAAEHEHYWVDAYDDETGWHCTRCGITEYPEPPFGAEPPVDLAAGDHFAYPVPR